MPRRHRFRRWLLVVVCVAVPAVGLASCSSPGDSPTPPSVASATAPIGPNDLDATLPTPGAYPTDDEDSRAAAEAGATMSSFIRTDLTAEDWLDELSANLTADAITAYYGTDPLQVPARSLTGAPRWNGSTSTYLAGVVVPTDVGDYRLLLVREGQNSPWLVQTISPPDGLP